MFVVLRRRNHKRKNEMDVKITYFNKMEREKRVREVILGQKLIINHPSLVDEGEKTKILATTHKRDLKSYLFNATFIFIFTFRFLSCAFCAFRAQVNIFYTILIF